MAKEEAKAEAKGESPAATAAKAPMFSKAGFGVLVVLCLVSAGVPVLLRPKPAEDGGKADPHDRGGESSDHGKDRGFKAPVILNTVELDEISMPYRESGAGGPRRSMKVTVVLKVVTKIQLKTKMHEGVEEPVEPDEKADKELHEEDVARHKAVQKLKPEIYDKICNILRGRSPDDFATNEMIEQTKQQIRRTLNDEIFSQQEVIQAVLFTKSQF